MRWLRKFAATFVCLALIVAAPAHGDAVEEAFGDVVVTIRIPDGIGGAVEITDVELIARPDARSPERVPLRGAIRDGVAHVSNVPAGDWKVRASGRLRGGYALALDESSVTVTPGGTHHVLVELDDSLYHGRVVRGGIGVAGTINMVPANRRDGARSAVAQANADGEFAVLLDGRGEYRVSIQEPGGGGVRLSAYTTFDDPNEPVEIELPTGRIMGRVIDRQGRAVEKSVVTATRRLANAEGTVYARTRTNGTFELFGVAPGVWEVEAESEDSRSDAVTIAFDQSDVDGVTLTVDPTARIRIRVLDPGGSPVRGVLVSTRAFRPDQTEVDFQARMTNERGETDIRVSRGELTKPRNLVLYTSDGRLSCDFRPMNGAAESVSLPRQYGALTFVARNWDVPEGVENWLVSPSGCAVPFLVKAEQTADGAAKTFERLAAGTWRYVQPRTPAELALVFAGEGRSLPARATVVVETGKRTRAKVDAQP